MKNKKSIYFIAALITSSVVAFNIYTSYSLKKGDLVGSCPRCERTIKGRISHWDAVTPDGKNFGGESFSGKCTNCNVPLEATGYSNKEKQEVKWEVPKSYLAEISQK